MYVPYHIIEDPTHGLGLFPASQHMLLAFFYGHFRSHHRFSRAGRYPFRSNHRRTQRDCAPRRLHEYDLSAIRLPTGGSLSAKRGDEVASLCPPEGVTPRSATSPSARGINPAIPFWTVFLTTGSRCTRRAISSLCRSTAADSITRIFEAPLLSTSTTLALHKIPFVSFFSAFNTRVRHTTDADGRNSDWWGNGAHELNPERFLGSDKAKQASVGVHANLDVICMPNRPRRHRRLNFPGGLRACIGWKFSCGRISASP
ncbi:hypothetical protein DENSPDRAFT_340408 [Dentipellis sp. KUC8613]|nr:hypothetical protein DENSPDRAFT_340408 [Dentipellis sp. KUC8613]